MEFLLGEPSLHTLDVLVQEDWKSQSGRHRAITALVLIVESDHTADRSEALCSQFVFVSKQSVLQLALLL